MLLRTASAIGEGVVAGLIALVGVALGTTVLFTFYSLVVTPSDVVTWGAQLTPQLVAASIWAMSYTCERFPRKVSPYEGTRRHEDGADRS